MGEEGKRFEDREEGMKDPLGQWESNRTTEMPRNLS